jgi:hypothetical protein
MPFIQIMDVDVTCFHFEVAVIHKFPGSQSIFLDYQGSLS